MNRFLPALLASLVLIAAALTGSASAGLMYAPDYNADVINVFSNTVSPGQLTAISGSPFAIPSSGALGWAMTPDAKLGVAAYLYGGVRSYSLSDAGAVTPAQAVINFPGQGAYSAAVAPNGKSVYLPTRPSPGPSAGIRAYSIAASGTLTEKAGSPYLALESFLDAAITPDGTKLYALKNSAIFHETLLADGTFGAGGQQPIDNVLRIATSPDGRFLFTTGYNAPNSEFRVFSIGADGELTAVGSPVIVGGGSESSPAISASGGFAYIADSNSDKVFSVRIAPDGTPSVIGATDNVVDAQEAVVSPDGKFLYVTKETGDYAMQVSPIGPSYTPTGFVSSVYYRPYESSRLFFRPGQGTNAEFAVSAGVKPLTMSFDASKTRPKLGGLGDFNWEFGDGTIASNPAAVTTHTFAKAGVYDVVLAAADDTGCATKFVYTGQSTICNGSASSGKTIRVDTPPWITSLKVAPKTVKTKMKIQFKLTEMAKVRLQLQRPSTGRTVGGVCKRQTSKNKKMKKCTLWRSLGKPLKISGRSGSNTLKIDGRGADKTRPSGKYRLAATATDSAGGKSPLATAKFKFKAKK